MEGGEQAASAKTVLLEEGADIKNHFVNESFACMFCLSKPSQKKVEAKFLEMAVCFFLAVHLRNSKTRT